MVFHRSQTGNNNGLRKEKKWKEIANMRMNSRFATIFSKLRLSRLHIRNFVNMEDITFLGNRFGLFGTIRISECYLYKLLSLAARHTNCSFSYKLISSSDDRRRRVYSPLGFYCDCRRV